MQAIFDTLINSFIENEVGIANHFLNDELASFLKQNLQLLYKTEQLLFAGTGNNKLVTHDKTTRSDKIFWLDAKHENIHENSFFKLLDSFIIYLNATCYTGITGYEFHYTLYEEGSFYKKHIDRFKNNSSRAYSMIMYLNENWQPSHGGELCIHHNNQLQNISPNNGKCVFFKSNNLLHEVLLTHKPRLSITGWLKRD
ncbi:MAG: 2OG-Fe(II) oxygenase [Bacteroidetes bacterium]|nr:2OG-Fe(II) oxygenase [Bacteroidota bacterium]